MLTCEWKSLQDGVTVLMGESVVRGVRQLAIDGFIALPRRGMEVGGVLLGIIYDDEVRLDGFEEVTCEHRYGPSYALSVDDRVALQHLLAGWPATKAPVVGFFRSFTSRDPVIEEADEAFVREHFPHGSFVYLMLQPLSVENCVASFRFFRDGILLPDSGTPPSPFAVTATPSEPVAPPPPAMEAAAGLPPPIARSQFHSDEGEGTVLTRARWWAPALMCLGSAIAGAMVNQVAHQITNVAREPRWADLHLDARPVGGQLEVKWDATARARVATRGRLEVTDGDSRQEIELNPDQLRSGKLTYAPSNEDLRLRLQLDAKGSGIVEDGIRVKIGSDVLAKSATKPSNEAHPAPAPVTSPTERPHVAVLPAEVHTVQPRIPDGIRARIAGPVVIPVEVEVSEKGQVTRAVAERGQADDSVRRYLADQAQQAAMKWRFRPARMTSGDRIAASKVLHFVFTPHAARSKGRR